MSARPLVGLWLLLLGPLAFAQADAGFARAVQMHQSGDLEGALREYQAVLAADASRVDARSNSGAVLVKLGRYQEAIEQYKLALKSAPAEAAPHLRLNLALAYYKSVQIPEAEKELTRLHAEDPRNLNASLLLADCYLRTADFKAVIELLTPLEHAEADDRAITYMLGLALIRDGQVAEGQQRVDKILSAGDSAESRFLLAMAMFMAKDYQTAVQGFGRAIELNPTVPTLQSFYGQSLLLTGDADAAAAAFNKELSTNPNDYDSNLGLGQILAYRGKAAEATAYLERAVRLRPGSQEAQSALANLRDGRPAAATDPVGGIPVGAAAPNFDLLALDNYRGRRPVVLVFGSYSCPQFRGGASSVKALHDKFHDRVQFLLVYIKEAHSSEQWQSSINEREGIITKPAGSLTEKQEHASACVRKLNVRFPSVTDGMDGQIEAAYDAWPSRVYLVGTDGRVAFNSRFGELSFHAAALEAAIQKALAHP